MDESVYARVIAERIKSRGISRREWGIVRRELKSELEEENGLNAEKDLGEAERLRVSMTVNGWLDEIYEEEGESIGSIVEREIALDELRKQAPSGALDDFKAERLPPLPPEGFPRG